ncbi:MAG: stage 0 sporulation protein [Ruminococcaceae bacterium]|nr:stage 0 sporulation protein [Oscillospiraceae bacterium]
MQNELEKTAAVAEEAEEIRDPEAPVEVVGLKFRLTGKTYYFDPCGISVESGKFAIVETARGVEIGECVSGNHNVKEREVVRPLRPVLRIATEADIRHDAENREKETKACEICRQKIAQLGLEMSLINAEYTFDNNKLLFYFTAEGRVDFRDLVKELASVFRTRIELRQIGIRDEAKLMGGLGVCGRPFCCHSFLSDFVQVSIKMAKEQNFSLNSAKISGACGRLMCCLRYEHETYDEEIKKTPAVGCLVETANGNGVITEINPLAALVRVKLTDKPEAPKYYPRDEVKVLMTAKQRKAENAARNGAPKADDEEVSDEAEDITLTTEVTVTANPVQGAEGDASRQHPKKHFKKHRKKPPQAE